MWFRKTKPVVETVEIRMDRYVANSLIVSGFDTVYDENDLYLKVYYTEGTTQYGKNTIYADLFERFLDIGWRFLGVREYANNHEMCFTFIKA